MYTHEKVPWYEDSLKYLGSATALIAVIGAGAVGISQISDKGPQHIKYPASADYIGILDYRGTAVLGTRINKGATFLFDQKDSADMVRLDCGDGRKQILERNYHDMLVVCLQDKTIFNGDRALVVSHIDE